MNQEEYRNRSLARVIEAMNNPPGFYKSGLLGLRVVQVEDVFTVDVATTDGSLRNVRLPRKFWGWAIIYTLKQFKPYKGASL